MKLTNLNLTAMLVGFGLFLTPNMKGQNNSEIVSFTGCLARGDRAHEYSMKDPSGKTYELLPSDGVTLRRHVGHEVQVSGTVTKKRHEGETAEGNKYLKVRDVKMISRSCS